MKVKLSQSLFDFIGLEMATMYFRFILLCKSYIVPQKNEVQGLKMQHILTVANVLESLCKYGVAPGPQSW